MYNPERFKIDDQDEIRNFITENPFGSVISNCDGEITVSHLPLVLVQESETEYLYGHMARANSQWQTLHNSKVKVIFLGAHAYISPNYYEVNDVPTWNYLAVHMKGELSLIEDEKGIVDSLLKLSANMNDSWKFFIPDDLKREKLAENIIGFKIKISNTEFKKKLSQNKTSKDQSSIIEGLSSSNDLMSQSLAQEMKRHYQKA